MLQIFFHKATCSCSRLTSTFKDKLGNSYKKKKPRGGGGGYFSPIITYFSKRICTYLGKALTLLTRMGKLDQFYTLVCVLPDLGLVQRWLLQMFGWWNFPVQLLPSPCARFQSAVEQHMVSVNFLNFYLVDNMVYIIAT